MNTPSHPSRDLMKGISLNQHVGKVRLGCSGQGQAGAEMGQAGVML